MARVITLGRCSRNARPTLWFNYATATATPWMHPALLEQYCYRTAGASMESTGATISLKREPKT